MVGPNTLSDDEYESQANSNSSSASASSAELRSSGKEDSTAPDSDVESEVDYITVTPRPLYHDSISALHHSDTELWLVRVPRHNSLRDGLTGSEVVLGDEELKSSAAGRMAGALKGSYVYRDHGPVDASGPRATFVTKDETGKARIEVAKPFARLVSVTFDVALKSLSGVDPPPRKYPEPPKDQSLKYRPIGSARNDLPPLHFPSQAVLSQHRLNGTKDVQGLTGTQVENAEHSDIKAEGNAIAKSPPGLTQRKRRRETQDTGQGIAVQSALESKEENEDLELEKLAKRKEKVGKVEKVSKQLQNSPSSKEASTKKKRHDKKMKRLLGSQTGSSPLKRKKKRKNKEESA